MTPLDWLVLGLASAAIGWVNWYFFLADRGGAVAAAVGQAVAVVGPGDAPEEVPEVVITVHGGYEPRTVRVPAGRAVRLVFDRQETSSCSEEVVFADFGIRKFLPAYERTAIEITPPAAGSYEFTCGMAMLRGRLIAI